MGTLLLAAARAEGFGGQFGPDDHGHPVMRWVMLLVFLAVVAGLIWSLVALSRSRRQLASGASPSATTPTPSAAALQILNERLARGEIDPADYEARKRLLT